MNPTIIDRETVETPNYSRKFSLACIISTCLLAVLLFGKSSEAADIHVSAAASLTDALKEIAAVYEKDSGDKILFNFAASSFLALQIEQGAPADIFFSADEAKMDGLEKKGLVEKDTRKSRLSNTLVIVVASDAGPVISSPQDLASERIKRVALAETKTVPAGIYAKEYLEKANLWAAVGPKVIPTENVRGALSAVESGNVDAGIVYKTDAAISKKVKIAHEIPTAAGPAISYPVALLKEARQPQAARKFLDYLISPTADRVFEKFGFLLKK